MKNDTTTFASIIGLIVFILVFAAIGPFITIWALNTLFSLAIPYTLTTWAATAWLGLVLSGISATKKNNA